MQIVWDQDVIEKMRATHTLMELETFDFKGSPIVTYCVIPAEKLIRDLANLPALTDLHNQFLKAFKENNVEQCKHISSQLYGKFDGELDTFYDEIIKRLSK